MKLCPLACWHYAASRLTALGCDNWHSWTGFAPLNYFIYFLFAVSGPRRLPEPEFP